MRWHTKPITQLVVMLVVMSVVIGAQSTASAFLTGDAENKSVAKVEDTGLRKVAGGCSYRAGSPLQTGQTETNPQNANPRWPISDPRYRGEYDVLNSRYFTQQSNNDPRYRGYIDDGPAPEGNVIGMLGSMFGYKPNQFTAAYDMKYVDAIGQGIRGNDPSDIKGDYPILQIPVPANKEVLMARTGYDIGGGEAMVVFADANRVVLHIGRHEYFAGTGQCLLGPCSGGYWIYLSDVCVNDNIVDSYNSVKAAQEAAGPNLNPIQLPIVPEGYPLAKALGTSVKLALRDNGPFILMNKPGLWQGYPEQNFAAPTNTPPANATATPTTIPTVPATPPPPAAGKGSSRITVTNSTGNLNCAASLVTFWSGPTERIAVVPRESYLSGQQELAVLTDLEPGTYTVDSTYGLFANGSFTKTFARSRVVTNVVINPNQITESSINLLDAGPDYNECVAATPPVTSPTVPPGTTLTPAPTGPEVQVGDSNGYPQITVYVDNNCSAVYCNELRRFIERMESFDMTQIRILWLTLQTSQYNFANINDLRTVHEASQQYQGFTFKVLERVGNPFPSIDQITSLYLDIPLEPLFYLK